MKIQNKTDIYTINYDKIVDFKERITRFTIKFNFKENLNSKGNPKEDFAHLHDTGRLTELLIDGAELLIKEADRKNLKRKTKWDVIAVKVHGEIILINTAFHRYITESIFHNEKISDFLNIKIITAVLKPSFLSSINSFKCFIALVEGEPGNWAVLPFTKVQPFTSM